MNIAAVSLVGRACTLARSYSWRLIVIQRSFCLTFLRRVRRVDDSRINQASISLVPSVSFSFKFTHTHRQNKERGQQRKKKKKKQQQKKSNDPFSVFCHIVFGRRVTPLEEQASSVAELSFYYILRCSSTIQMLIRANGMVTAFIATSNCLSTENAKKRCEERRSERMQRDCQDNDDEEAVQAAIRLSVILLSRSRLHS